MSNAGSWHHTLIPCRACVYVLLHCVACLCVGRLVRTTKLACPNEEERNQKKREGLMVFFAPFAFVLILVFFFVFFFLVETLGSARGHVFEHRQ